MSFRFNSYNEARFFRAIPFFRQFVVPGQTLTAKSDVRVQTGAFDRNLLNGGFLNMYFFYVPFRLVWDQWVDYVARETDSVTTFPTTTTPFPALFENSGTFNVFARRAYKLIYNQYFGSEDFGKQYVVNTDTNAALLPVRTTDQFLTRVIPDTAVGVSKLDAPVTGVAPNQVAEIPLNDLRRELKASRSVRRAQMTGDKYVDSMARMGVDLGWSVQMAPEYLGGLKKRLEPKETRATYTGATPSPVTGAPYASFKEQCSVNSRKAFFGEHGIVLGLAVVRPLDFKDGFAATPDSLTTGDGDVFFGDNQEGSGALDLANVYGTSSQLVATDRFSYLFAGVNATGNKSATGKPWVTEDVSPSVNDAVYPVDIDLVSSQLDNQVAVSAMTTTFGASRVRRNVV